MLTLDYEWPFQTPKVLVCQKDNIDRAINKGKDKDSASFTEPTFEGYLPNGIAAFVECTTDNNQRTVANIRAIFNKSGGSLGTNGSLSFMFDRKGIFIVPVGDIDQDEFEMEFIDAGAEDLVLEDDGFFSYNNLFGRFWHNG